jgi:hypothetical protein
MAHELSHALIANGSRSGAVLQYTGPGITCEIEEASLSDLEDLGLDDAPPGLSIWTGKYIFVPGYVDGHVAPGEGWCEPRGSFRPLTDAEWASLRKGELFWPLRDGDSVTEPQPEEKDPWDDIIEKGA